MISRRNFLAGLSTATGAALLGPSLRAIADEPVARRFVIVVEGNCIEPVTFMSPNTRTDIESNLIYAGSSTRWLTPWYGHTGVLEHTGDLAMAPAFAALTGAPGDLDLTPHAASVLGLSSLVTGGGHSTFAGLLSCTRSSAGRPTGQTIDAWLASQPSVRGTTPFDAVRLGINSANEVLSNDTCAFGARRPAPVIVDPETAHGNLFGVVGSGADYTQRGRLLDFAHTDATGALAQFGGNSRERAKLERYLEAIEAIQLRRQRLDGLSASLGTVVPPGADVNPAYGSDDALEKLGVVFELATAALLGELTHVVVIAIGTGNDFDLVYPSILPFVRRHDLHHTSAGNQPRIDAIHAITAAHVGLVSDMARTLAATPEPNSSGTMLDHTAILFMSENGEQHHSKALEFPALLMGGSAMGLNTGGRSLVYPGYQSGSGHRQVSNLFNTLGHAAGVPLDDFGAEGLTRVAEGPLSELYTAS
jgi:hypothetical protein